MFGKAILAVSLVVMLAEANGQRLRKDVAGVRSFIARWNAAYIGLNAKALASLETPDYEMINRFGHWIKSEGPEFNQQIWAATFTEIFRGKPGPARTIESIRFVAPNVGIVEARANHPDGVTLDDGSHIPPFCEINTYALIQTDGEWKVALAAKDAQHRCR